MKKFILIDNVGFETDWRTVKFMKTRILIAAWNINTTISIYKELKFHNI